MSDQEVIETFMGLKSRMVGFSNNIRVVYNSNPSNWVSTPDYLTWNELMPVVEKIESLGFQTTIYTSAFVVTQNGAVVNHFVDGPSKIAATYEGVLLFIRWYTTTQTKVKNYEKN